MIKKKYTIIVLLIFTTCTINFQKEGKEDIFTSFWDDCDIIAQYNIIDGDTILVCNTKNIKQRKIIPLELLVEDFEIIKLDSNVEEGWIDRRFPRVFFTDNYIAVGMAKKPVLLFQKDGTFLREVGKIGQGPGEFSLVDNLYLDENQNRIYILPMTSKQVVLYDFEGAFLQSIPLHEFVFMGSTLKVLPQDQLLITKAKGPGTEYCLWIQDFEGNVIKGIKSLDYFEESQTTAVGVMSKNTTNNIDFNMIGQHCEYHYDIDQNRLKPVLRIEGEEGFGVIHEFPKHFIVQKTSAAPKADETIEAIIIDKETLKGCFFDGFQLASSLVYNQYGMLFPIGGPYFFIADFGSEILTSIQQMKQNNLSNNQMKELDELKITIGDPLKYEQDDDVFLFKAKYK